MYVYIYIYIYICTHRSKRRGSLLRRRRSQDSTIACFAQSWLTRSQDASRDASGAVGFQPSAEASGGNAHVQL